DDLLQLARLTRAMLKPARVDLSELCRGVVEELRKTSPDRRIDIGIADGMAVTCDQRLIRIAMENLIGNAWKFTQLRSDARISVGTRDAGGGKICYFVKDNGAGFDMAYSDKLFRAFQRLHSDAEFEGTGIGLATVARIVHRHGGRIWAEGKPDQGA